MIKLGTATFLVSPVAWDGVTLDGMPRILPTRGVLDDLQTDVFVLQDGTRTAVIATLDQCFITDDHFSNLRARLDGRLPGAHLILCSTHDHSGTAIPFDRADEKAAGNCTAARKIVYDGFSSALEQALREMREVEVAAGRIRLPVWLGRNRRAKLANGACIQAWGAGPLIPPGQKCAGKSGPDAVWIDVLAFRDPDAAEPRAMLSSYASHVHLYEIPYFSGEVAGAARRVMRERHPDLHLMYALGFAGDNALQFAHPIPKDDEDSRIEWQKEKAAAFGAAFSAALSDQLRTLKYSAVDSLQYTSDSEPGIRKGECMLVETLRIGPHAVCSLPGEMFIEFEQQLRRDMPCETLLPMAYNRSLLGYIATPLGFEEGGYETMRGSVDKIPYSKDYSGPVRSRTDSGRLILAKAREQLGTLFAEGPSSGRERPG